MSINESVIEKYRREMMEMYSRKTIESKEEAPLPDWSEVDLEEREEEAAYIFFDDPFEPEDTIEPENTIEPEDTIELEEVIEPEPEIADEPDLKVENAEQQEKEQTDGEPCVCSLCSGKMALCSFRVENLKNGKPVESAQIMLYRDNGFFVRALTNENGETCEIPVLCDDKWRLSVTAQGYISVSSAAVEPSPGEKLTVPVMLDESLSLSDIFAEHNGGIIA